jgi:hypothetical protein
MKEADKRARITVAYGGLLLLRQQLSKDPNYRSTRAHLFAVPNDKEKSPELVRAVKTKDWQRDYIQRLVDAEILKKGSENGQDLYSADPDKVEVLIADHDNWGLRLSKFLFPREAGIPNELAEDDDESEDESGSDKGFAPSTTPAPEDEEGPILQMGERSVTALIRLLNSVREQQEMNVSLMKHVLVQYEAVETAINREREQTKEISQAEKEFPNYVKNRLKELEAKIDKQYESLSFAAKTLARVEADIKSLPSMVSSILPSISKMLGVPEGKTLTIHVDSLMKHYLVKLTGREMGTLRDLLSGLRAKIADLDAVEDLAMRTVEAIEKQGEQDEL